MSKRSEVYEELRQAVRRLGSLKGKTTTVDVMEHLDDLWGSLVRTRAVMVKTLMIRGDIESAIEVPARDFLNLYLQIHNPKRESRLCEYCCGSVEFGITECPYCGEKVNGQNSQQFLTGVTIDFDLQTKGPDWDIETDPTDILNKNKPIEEEKLEFIRPITKRDDIIGPTGHRTHGKTNKSHASSLNRPTKNLLRWIKKRELAKYIPYTHEQLLKLTRGERWCLASLFKDKSDLAHEQLFTKPKAELIQFILGHQGSKPILDIGDPPVGSLRDLDEVLSEDEEDDDGGE